VPPSPTCGSPRAAWPTTPSCSASASRESIDLDELDPTDVSSLHLQNLVIARMGSRTGVGVLEQACFGPHEPSGLTGLNDGHP
jgi:hypothetical protein